MNVGEKVRSLRVAKMMSQAELAGTEITRNMISCIENGTALPSLSTVVYLAKKLGVSAGYLLAEENDDLFYRKMEQMSNLKKAFREKEWEACRSLCESLMEKDDDELAFLYTQSTFELAKERFWSGKLHHCCRLFDEALRSAAECLYPQPQIAAEASVYFACLSRISPTLFSEEMDEGERTEFVSETPFALYLQLMALLDDGKALTDELQKLDPAGFFYKHLQAKIALAAGNYPIAKEALLNLLQSSDCILNEVQLYFVLSDLEIACRETEDYKAAYRFANERLQLHEQLLRD